MSTASLDIPNLYNEPHAIPNIMPIPWIIASFIIAGILITLTIFVYRYDRRTFHTKHATQHPEHQLHIQEHDIDIFHEDMLEEQRQRAYTTRMAMTLLPLVACLIAGSGTYDLIRTNNAQLQQDIAVKQQENADVQQAVHQRIQELYGDTTQLQLRPHGAQADSQRHFRKTLTQKPYGNAPYAITNLSLLLDDGAVIEDARIIREASLEPDISHTVRIEVASLQQQGQYETFTLAKD